MADIDRYFDLEMHCFISEHFMYFILALFFPVFLGPHLWHMEVPGLGVELELQPPAYTRATATQDLKRICDLHRCLWQRRILNPLNKARN